MARSDLGKVRRAIEIENDAELSVREGRIGIRSRHVIEYGVTKEVRYLMKGQVYWRGLSVCPDI
jgi:hypothetical protein